ncbi:MAG: MbcA/ParS/Xre antitoxin family protein [Bdellovibrionales bacterium]|nr:MbcA/ParS/Xre antitoxin family protein [Bdellovibrionales bacterium]
MSVPIKEIDVLEELYTKENPTEINLKKLAKLLGVKDKEIATALGVDATSLSRKPYASSNPKLKQWHSLFNLIIRIFAEADPELTNEQIKIKMQRWLRTPRPEFNDRTALDEMLKGRSRKVRNLLEQLL